MVKQGKQLYMKHEFNKVAAKAGGREPFQKRGWDDDQASKFRITVELRQVVKGWFRSGTPTGELADSLVIVPGVHARLSNITADGRWLKTEKFWIGRKKVVRIAGRKVGLIMQSWRNLRSKCPELFEGISLMQQPAAVMDSILNNWALEEHGMKYPVSIWQRDLSGGGGFSEQSRKAMQLVKQIPVWVAGKMTAALQVTDTDFAYLLKCIANEEKRNLKFEMQAAALKCDESPTLKCGAYELLKVIHDSLKRLKARTLKENLVMKACLRNGLLAWRQTLNGFSLQ